MKGRYAFQGFEKEKMARAKGTDLPISLKHATMVCKAIKGKSIERARAILTEAIELKKAIPFTRFNRDKGHKPKIGPGRFVPKTCIEILKIVNSAESNGHQKNLGNMKLIHASAHTASKPWHFGRWRRRQMKRAHIEIVVSESEKKERQKKAKQKEEPKEKQEVKKEDNNNKAEKTEKKEEKTKEEPKKQTKND